MICYACKNTVAQGSYKCPFCTADIEPNSGVRPADYSNNNNDTGGFTGFAVGCVFMYLIWIYAIVPAWHWVTNLFS